MEPEAFEYALNSGYEYIYNNESELEPLQYPLAMSRFKVPRFANDLYTDDTSQYFTYSGTANSLIVTKEKDGRYKNLTLRAYSGDSFKFYFQAGSGISDSDLYFSGPLTTSGVYSTMTQYATQSGALTNAITFSAPTNNSSVYTLPSIQNLNWIRLFHQSTNGTTPYRIYQFLPRTLIQVDDLEADVIDAVTIRVSGSIVVSADDLAPGSITGDKIMAGTVSGVLITPGGITATQIAAGTITANQIAVSGITANRLNVSQLDAVAANMGTLIVNSGISVGTNGYIWTGTGSAATPTTGLKIYTTSGVSRLTTYAGGVAQVDIASNGKLLAGGGAVILDSAGMTAGKTVVNSNGITIGDLTSLLNNNDALKIMVSGTSGNNGGISFYNGAYSSISPQSAITTDSTNNFVIANNAPGGNLIIGNEETGGTIFLYNSAVDIMPTANNLPPGGITGYGRDSIGGELLRYFLGPDNFLFRTDAGQDTFEIDAATGTITTDGGIFAGTSNNKFIVAAGTGNTAIAGTLGVTGTLTANNNFLQYNYGGMYKNTAQNVAAGADARITFQVTYVNGTLDVVASSRLTTTHAGLYIITAGVISATIGSTFTVVTGGAFNTGTVIAGIIQADMRAYVTKPVYLSAGTNLELWVRNSGGAAMAISTGTNGSILTAAKVG